jgi:tetratricopeptide (TPR) repeat protein
MALQGHLAGVTRAIKAQQWEQAFHLASEGLRESPASADLLLLAGYAANAAGKGPQAEVSYRRVLDLDGVPNERGELVRALPGSPEEAKLTSAQVKARRGLFEMFVRNGNYAGQAEILQIQLAGGAPSAFAQAERQVLFAQVLFILGELDASIDMLETARRTMQQPSTGGGAAAPEFDAGRWVALQERILRALVEAHSVRLTASSRSCASAPLRSRVQSFGPALLSVQRDLMALLGGRTPGAPSGGAGAGGAASSPVVDASTAAGGEVTRLLQQRVQLAADMAKAALAAAIAPATPSSAHGAGSLPDPVGYPAAVETLVGEACEALGRLLPDFTSLYGTPVGSAESPASGSSAPSAGAAAAGSALSWSLLPEATLRVVQVVCELTVAYAWHALAPALAAGVLHALQAATSRAASGPSPVWLVASALLEAAAAAPPPTATLSTTTASQSGKHAAVLSRCMQSAVQAQASLAPASRHSIPWLTSAVAGLQMAHARLAPEHKQRAASAQAAVEAAGTCWLHLSATEQQRVLMIRTHAAFKLPPGAPVNPFAAPGVGAVPDGTAANLHLLRLDCAPTENARPSFLAAIPLQAGAPPPPGPVAIPPAVIGGSVLPAAPSSVCDLLLNTLAVEAQLQAAGGGMHALSHGVPSGPASAAGAGAGTAAGAAALVAPAVTSYTHFLLPRPTLPDALRLLRRLQRIAAALNPGAAPAAPSAPPSGQAAADGLCRCVHSLVAQLSLALARQELEACSSALLQHYTGPSAVFCASSANRHVVAARVHLATLRDALSSIPGPTPASAADGSGIAAAGGMGPALWRSAAEAHGQLLEAHASLLTGNSGAAIAGCRAAVDRLLELRSAAASRSAVSARAEPAVLTASDGPDALSSPTPVLQPAAPLSFLHVQCRAFHPAAAPAASAAPAGSSLCSPLTHIGLDDPSLAEAFALLGAAYLQSPDPRHRSDKKLANAALMQAVGRNPGCAHGFALLGVWFAAPDAEPTRDSGGGSGGGRSAWLVQQHPSADITPVQGDEDDATEMLMQLLCGSSGLPPPAPSTMATAAAAVPAAALLDRLGRAARASGASAAPEVLSNRSGAGSEGTASAPRGYDRARQCWQRALAVRPDEPVAACCLVDAHLQAAAAAHRAATAPPSAAGGSADGASSPRPTPAESFSAAIAAAQAASTLLEAAVAAAPKARWAQVRLAQAALLRATCAQSLAQHHKTVGKSILEAETRRRFADAAAAARARVTAAASAASTGSGVGDSALALPGSLAADSAASRSGAAAPLTLSRTGSEVSTGLASGSGGGGSESYSVAMSQSLAEEEARRAAALEEAASEDMDAAAAAYQKALALFPGRLSSRAVLSTKSVLLNDAAAAEALAAEGAMPASVLRDAASTAAARAAKEAGAGAVAAEASPPGGEAPEAGEETPDVEALEEQAAAAGTAAAARPAGSAATVAELAEAPETDAHRLQLLEYPLTVVQAAQCWQGLAQVYRLMGRIGSAVKCCHSALLCLRVLQLEQAIAPAPAAGAGSASTGPAQRNSAEGAALRHLASACTLLADCQRGVSAFEEASLSLQVALAAQPANTATWYSLGSVCRGLARRYIGEGLAGLGLRYVCYGLFAADAAMQLTTPVATLQGQAAGRGDAD